MKKVKRQKLFVKLFVLVLTFNFLLLTFNCYSQVGVGINTLGAAADGSAILDVSSTTQGLLIPRMSTLQRNAIVSPANSLLIYNTTTQCYEAYNSGTLSWVTINCIGCQAPSQPGAITGSGTVCQSQNGAAYSVTNVSGVTYSWTYSGTGFSIASGSGTNSITANFSSIATSGTLSVVGSSVCGSSPAQTFAITVNPVAAQPGAISGSGTVCQSQNSIAYSVTNSAGITYTWNYSGNGFSIATGTGTNSITANYSAAATSGTLSVTGSNSCGSGTAQTLAITVTPIPTAPTAAINTATSTEIDWNWYSVSGATGYKWNTTNNYAGATNNGTSTTHAQTTGLICGLNTLYVWAYNSCGNSSPVILTQTIGDIPCSGAGTIGTIAGDGSNSDLGDGGPAACSEVNMVYGIAADASGNAYVAEYSGSRIRKITASTGIITTIAGNGTLGFSGDGGQATAAAIHGANGVAVDASGNVYIADYGNHRIRKVTVSTGIITTIAGGGIGGDGGPATAATLGNIYGVGIDGSGNVYIADYSSAVIRKVTVSSGIISTIAGTGVQGYNSDGIAATAAKLYYPTGVAVDGSGNVYISDSYNARIRKVTGGIISTYTGNGTGGYSGDGGQATAAQILSPYGVALDASGNVYIADFNNDLIRKVTTSTGIITSIAGNYSNGFSGDGGPATNAQIVQPTGVAVDATGNVYIADYGNARIRKVCK